MSELATLSASMQDYLEAILELEGVENTVRITDIANKLKIAKASANQTMNKLKEMGYVRQQVYGPVELTEDGRKMAEKVIRRHRKLRYFLTEVLGVDAAVAENDACLMEHAVSIQTMERLTDFLCRNGYIVEECNVNVNTDTNSDIPEAVSEKRGVNDMNVIIKALSDLKIGQKGIVVKIASKGAVRRRIMEMGIINGAEILVKGFAPLGDPMELGIKGYSLSLRKAEAAGITVQLV